MATEAEKKEAEKAEAEKKAGAFPRANPEDRYGATSGSNPKHPEGSPPPATRPAVADPNAVPSNIKQREEIRRKEDEEFAKRHANVAGGLRDPQFQQPGAPSQQWDKALESPAQVISEKTRLEMEAGKKKVEAAEKRDKEQFEKDQEAQDKRELDQLANATSETGEQLEAKRKEAERQRETWGDPPKTVNRNTIAGAKEEK